MWYETVRRKHRKLYPWSQYLFVLIVCGMGVFLSYLIGNHRYAQRVLLLVLLWAAASSSFNIISGFGGQVVFGYMMFVGTGAYTTVLLLKFMGVSPWLGMWVGAVVSVLIALIIGIPTLRLLRGAFFALTTVAFPMITISILNYLRLEEINIPYGGGRIAFMQFRDLRYYVLIASVLLAINLIIVAKIEGSRFGYALKSLKQNETAAEGMGVNTYRAKLIAFMLSAGLGALMGTVYAFSVLYVLSSASTYGILVTVRVLSITILGGMATLWGPVIGAILLVPIGEFLNAQFGGRYPGVQDIIYGAALIITILYVREGIWVKIRLACGSFIERMVLKRATVKDSDEYRHAKQQIAIKQDTGFEAVPAEIVDRTVNESLVKIEGLSKSFGGVSALRDLNIEVPKGKITGIIGPNGAGKTTLFNVINGYLKPDQGRVFLEGKDVTKLMPHDLCSLGIGRTFQIPQIFSSMNFLENIMIGGFNRGSNIAEVRAAAEKVAEQMGLSSRIYNRAVGLTLWEIKALELSRALATQPRLLLVDEPMAGLNPEEADRTGEVIRKISKTGVTIIIIEHIVQSLAKIADWMVGLDDGRKVAEGTPKEVISDPHIVEAYLGVKWRERYAKS